MYLFHSPHFFRRTDWLWEAFFLFDRRDPFLISKGRNLAIAKQIKITEIFAASGREVGSHCCSVSRFGLIIKRYPIMTELVDCDAYTREELIQLMLSICNVCRFPAGLHRRQGKKDNGEASNFLFCPTQYLTTIHRLPPFPFRSLTSFHFLSLSLRTASAVALPTALAAIGTHKIRLRINLRITIV